MGGVLNREFPQGGFTLMFKPLLLTYLEQTLHLFYTSKISQKHQIVAVFYLLGGSKVSYTPVFVTKTTNFPTLLYTTVSTKKVTLSGKASFYSPLYRVAVPPSPQQVYLLQVKFKFRLMSLFLKNVANCNLL